MSSKHQNKIKTGAASPTKDATGKASRLSEAARDITAREQAEKELQKVNRALRLISLCNQEMVRATDETVLLQSVCRLAVESGGYRMAWVGYAEQDEAKRVRPVAQAGFEEGYLDIVNITWADVERGRGPTGTAIRTGKLVYTRNIPADPAFNPWRAEAARRGYASSIALPLMNDDHCLGALTMYSGEPGAFDPREIELLTEMAGDLAYGIGALRHRAERLRAEEELQLRESFLSAITENQPGLLWLKDAEGRFLMVNKAFAAACGRKDPEQVQGLTDLDVWSKELAEKYRADDQRVMTTGNACMVEEMIIVGNSQVWHETFKTPVRDGKGLVIGTTGYARDITGRKKAEAALRESETRLQSILESTGDGILAVDKTGKKVLKANRRFAEMWRIPQSLVDAGDNQAILNSVLSQLADPDGFLKTVWTLYGTDGVVVNTLVFKDGRIFERHGFPMLLDGKVIGRIWSFRDITGRKRAEAALRESEEKHRVLIETTATGFVIVDAKGVVLDANDEYARLAGYEKTDQIFGRRVTDWTAAYDRDRNAGEVLKCVASGFVRGLEVDYVHPDGAVVPIEINASTLGTGDELKILTLCRDITERKRATDALRQSQALYQSLITQVPAGLFRKDREGRFVVVNPMFCQLKGLSVEEIMGKTPTELADYERAKEASGSLNQPPRQRTLAAQGTDHHQRIIRTGETIEVEEAYPQPDGKVEYFHAVKTPVFDAEGRVIGSQGIQFDITELKRAEEFQARLATAVEQAAETIVITNTDGTILYVNPAFEKTTGYTRAEAIGQNPRFLKSGKQDPGFYRRMWEILGRGEVWSGHFINRRKDGALYEEEATLSPVRDTAGKIINYVAVKRDVTREVQLELQFRQAQKMEAVGQLASGVAHDFNNILNVIIGYGDLIANDLDPDTPLRNYAEEIRTAAQRAVGLTKQLLVFSRKQTVELVVLDLNETVKSLEKMLRRLIGENIEMTIVPGKDTGRIKADSGYIGQVLMNLAVNARDAMPKGGRLAITTSNVTLDENHTRARKGVLPGDYVMLSVSDTGTGMTDEVKARIFEALFTTKPAGKGTGLGLATCQAIVQQSGGHIDVDSVVGKGTTFKIYFPRNDKASPATAGLNPDEPLPRGTETLLLVEDEPSVRHLASKILKSLGYHVLRAGNGQDALHLVHECKGTPIHLVVTDVMMPVMGGKVMADWLKATYPDLKILFTSGYTDDAIAHEGVLEPGVAYLPKPYTPGSLAHKVRAMLDNVTDTTILRKPGSVSNQPHPGSL